MLALTLALPAAFLVAAGAAALARWDDRRQARVYASHRAMIRRLRVLVALYEAGRSAREAREAWESIGRSVAAMVAAFKTAAAPIMEAAESVSRAFADASRPKVTPPRDPRVRVVPERRR